MVPIRITRNGKFGLQS